jgi:hypothetical protein
MKSIKSEKETNELLDMLSSLPKSNENNTAKSFDSEPKKKWSRAPSDVRKTGRVNKTKGK